ncbi:MAG TPA: tetratricopeptide repeat protein, partial [Lacipirellula sp.]
PTLQAMVEAAKAKELPDDLRQQIEPPPKQAETSGDAQRGWALFQQGKMRSAESMFRKALAKDPENLSAMNGLGFCLLNSGKPAEAKPYFEKCLELEKDAAGPMNGLARCLQAEGKLDEAVKIWERMQKKYPGPTAATYGLANAYAERGEHTKAAAMYEQLVKASPDDPQLKEAWRDALVKATAEKGEKAKQ